MSNILITEKSARGDISVIPVLEQRGDSEPQRLALQPIYEALQVAPTSFDFSGRRPTVVEGIYDFFVLQMFKPDDSFAIVPAVGAGSIRYVVSLLIATGSDYRALWDDDKAGRESFDDAKKHFGEEEAKRRFRTLNPKGKKRTIMQDYVAGEELALWRDKLGLSSGASFKKVIVGVFYLDEQRRDEFVGLAPKTRRQIQELLTGLWA